jgi:hypothetical protein
MNHKIHEMEVDGTNYQIGYKVVTEDLKSTGLTNTPIFQYSEELWNTDLEHGLWAARVPSFATYIRSYMKQKYDVDTRTFIVALENIITANGHGVRAKSIKFLKELHDNKMYDVGKAL